MELDVFQAEYASVVWFHESREAQYCVDDLYFGNLCAIAGVEGVAVAEVAVNAAEVEADESGGEEKVNNFGEKVVDEFHFEIVEDGQGDR